MTIETLNAIKSEADGMFSSALELETRINNAETAGVIIPAEVDIAFTAVTTNLQTIINWVNQAIADGTAEEPQITVMQAFLAEIKTVFEKYSAVLSIIDGSEGYGLDYGGSGTSDVIQFTVTDPISGQVTTKEFIQTSLSAVDLV